jgi:2-polyprenyl-3-methyl-5-hydroxy-6-metoxy-1,4-benzoquinol methylase
VEATERLSLEATSEHTLLASEHVHRYELAARLCESARVLDLCCGTGYGAAILASTAGDVRGVDVDVATIETAIRTVGTSRISFVAASAGSYLSRVEPSDVDVIVCFEGLEHLDDLDEVADQLARLAAGGVKLIVSIPNSETWEEENPYHVTDFSLDSASKLLDRLGDAVLLAQNVAEGSLIVDPDDGGRDPAVTLRWPDRMEIEYANHFIGLVNFDPDTIRNSVSAKLELAYAPAYNRHIRNIEVANRELWRTNARLGWAAFSRSGSAAAAQVRREQSRLDERAAVDEIRIAELTAQVTELTATLAGREASLQLYIAQAQRRANRPTRRVARALALGAMRISGRSTGTR